jgi:phospholipid/cholesterol/gamma-HCH transport system substrate-binding protein
VSLTYQNTRFRYANQAVGAFVILTVIVFAAAFIFSGQVREWLEPGERIKVILPSDGLFGLSDGADVEILGTKAGKVLRIVINPDKQIHADVQIQSDMKAFVRRDSTAVIHKRFGVAGDSFLAISRGFGEPLDWELAVINASADRAPTESLGEILDEARTKIFPVIDDTQQVIRMLLAVVQELQDPEGDMHQVMGNLNAISGRIARGEGTVGRLLTEEKMMDDLVALVDRLNQSFARFDPLIDDLATSVKNVARISAKINEQSRSLPELTLKLKDLLVAVQAVMEDLRRTTPQLPRIAENVNDATDNVPVLMLQTQQVMVELEQLIKQLQSSWLLGSKTGGKRPISTRISPLEVRP